MSDLAARLRANADALDSLVVRAALGDTSDAIADLRAAADALNANEAVADAARAYVAQLLHNGAMSGFTIADLDHEMELRAALVAAVGKP